MAQLRGSAWLATTVPRPGCSLPPGRDSGATSGQAVSWVTPALVFLVMSSPASLRLRPRCDRPCGSRTAEQRYEVAPRQVEHAAYCPDATAIIRPLPTLFAQSVCRTSS